MDKRIPGSRPSAPAFDPATTPVPRRRMLVLMGASARCTHAGCRYAWSADAARFLCTCHGGEFAPDGTVLAGPPQRPLAKFPVNTVGAVLSVGVPGDFATPKESVGA